VNEYSDGGEGALPFVNYTPDAAGVESAIAERSAYPVDRQLLVRVLENQYALLNTTEAVKDNIAALLAENTYTVTTAHQPNLMTGYLYFIYKILHAIKLAEDLNKKHTDKRFVPVYYMGSEDNDLDELGVFKFRGDKYVWDGAGQKGAVGRMDTKSLKPLLEKMFRVFGPPGKDCDDLQEMVSVAYLKHKTIGAATQYLVNELFGRYGLVVIDPDDAALKSTFKDVMADELLHSNAQGIIADQTALLEQQYKSQIFIRPINLFYLHDQMRERIEKQGDRWVVLNSDITFDREQLLLELDTHPERFSPNVALRGLFQCTILPDVVFIGGGAEVAYWLQLKTLFAHYKVFYPVILLRQSVLWIDEAQARLRQQTGLSIPEIFGDEVELERKYIATNSDSDWQTSEETIAIEAIFSSLKDKAVTLDSTLGPAAEAVLAKMKRQMTTLEKKMLRAEKKKMDVHLQRIYRLKEALFPGGSLQERKDNFASYYLENGSAFLDIIKDAIKPLDNRFLVVEQYDISQ
jgi:bacillithiol synthase